ncbi:cytochrome c peroxidase [uncultured Dokdonia sp.]|uniref:cytochrome-c peroxidase n=1 Tax=uncultured Dokdonia sp. TaxID=575653 RepID=UPI0026145A54|nr:cytochrome c peroxidase [uncultured Dokdonia sp.]
MKITKYLILILFIWSCSSESGNGESVITTDDGPLTVTNPLLDFTVPANFPDATYSILQNPPTEKGFELGKKLFYDGQLASDGVVSCGFCHIQSFAFTHHTHITSHGVDGQIGTRNAQPLHNLAFMNEFTWDGAATFLDTQPIIPITSEVEMNETVSNVILKLAADDTYPTLFEEAFGSEGVSADRMFKALSQFMVMMVSANSKFDKLERGEAVTFTDQENAGRAIFDAKCASCHAGALQTDQSYRNNGLAMDPVFNDIGRERVTGLPDDNRKFKVPSLRNIEVTFPYMHDGRLATLEDVLNFYTDGMVDSPTLDEQFRRPDGTFGIDITPEEKVQLIAFLKTLTDNDFIEDRRFSEF